MGFRDEEISAMVSEIADFRSYRSCGGTLSANDFDASSASSALDVFPSPLDNPIRCDLLVFSRACPYRDFPPRAIALEMGRLPRPP